MKSFYKRATLTAAASTLLASGLTLLPVANTRAADPYDKALEARVEALERELNVMSNDSKGKNVQETSTDVPTFLKAGNKFDKELVITGEFLLRYEYSNADGQTRVPATQNSEGQTSRERFRLRLFADYKLSDSMVAGVAVQTSIGADGSFSTFSEGFDNYSLYLWRAFIGWKPNENITLLAGKFASGFYANSELLVDVDVSPTGLFQSIKFPISKTFDIQLNAAEYIFYDNNENAVRNSATLANGVTANPAVVKGGNNNTDAYLLTAQLLATFKPNENFQIKGGPGYFTYADNGGTASPTAVVVGANGFGAGNANGQAGNVLQSGGAFNSANATRNLWLATFNGDISMTLAKKVKLKLYEDFVYNFRGGSRDFEEYGIANYSQTDKIAFNVGFTIGNCFQLQKTNDFLILAEYRQVGLGSVDPNINDSNFNESKLGFRGLHVVASYAIRPWLSVIGTLYLSENLGKDKDVNIGVDNYNASQTVYLDLATKF